ncbi:DUF1573 domain-containing protein [Nostoc ellipsosporum NOK]|jgi:archaellum component FlaG (FlaF/FlaG flagellin family)|nr:DUF1573 domain-containing protein [Nostoc ellipsosporum NOK]
MKKLALLTAAFVFSVAAMAQSKPDEVAKFNTEKHDFGKVKQNNPATYYFEIKNVGNKPLVVENASASCGCTVPEKPKEPIMPGKSDKVKVVYNAAALGPINKEITIKFAGIDQPKVVRITGEVVTAEAFDADAKGAKKQ